MKTYSLEHDHQRAVFEWWKLAHKGLGAPDVLMAIPNGGHRNKSVAAAMKAEGARAGVPDMFLPVPRSLGADWNDGFYGGLWIELKRPEIKPKRSGAKGGVSDQQRVWIDQLAALGYKTAVCYGSKEAIDLITEYLK